MSRYLKSQENWLALVNPAWAGCRGWPRAQRHGPSSPASKDQRLCKSDLLSDVLSSQPKQEPGKGKRNDCVYNVGVCTGGFLRNESDMTSMCTRVNFDLGGIHVASDLVEWKVFHKSESDRCMRHQRGMETSPKRCRLDTYQFHKQHSLTDP